MKLSEVLLTGLVMGALVGVALFGDVIIGGRNSQAPQLTTYEEVDIQAALDSGGLSFETVRPLITARNAPGAVLTGYFGEEDDATPSLYLQPGASPQVTQHGYFLQQTGNPQK